MLKCHIFYIGADMKKISLEINGKKIKKEVADHTVLSVFLTIARTISSASFFIADPLRKANKIGSRIFSIVFIVLLDL